MRDVIVLRMNEIILKKGNRTRFERLLAARVEGRMKRIGPCTVRRDQGNIVVRMDEPLTTDQAERAIHELKKVFGIARILVGTHVPKDKDAILRTARDLTHDRTGTFKVFAKRADKSFPIASTELAPLVGEAILESNPKLSVDVHDPVMQVIVDVGTDAVFMSADACPGAGGLPQDGGKVVALLSGGIDSPVAAWKLMRRGIEVVFVHCTGRPFVGRSSEDKARRLATILADWQGGATLWTVPIGEAQREIMLKATESNRVLLYRRLMLRVAEGIARKEGALALVTGDAMGQVASQTLENIAAVSAVATMPLLRPLIGDDKEDIVRVARAIGTYDVSIEAHDDCCSLFMPKNPATRATAEALDAEETKYAPETLAGTVVEGASRDTIVT